MFQLTYNGNILIQGGILGIGLLLAGFIGIAYLGWEYFWKRLRENDVLKYEFITIIAHKFRTPLTTSKWLTEGLLATEAEPNRKEDLTEVKQMTDKLIGMTGTLIELTDTDNESKSSYEFERVELCLFVRTVSDAYKDAFHEKNLFFSVRCAEEPLFAKIDKSRMEFVLQTMLENAMNYSPPGRNVEVTVAPSKNKAAISVTDNGIGIDQHDHQHLFTKFFRAANAKSADTEGFGVGLYLAQSVARRHGGRIQAFSEGLNKGSTFTVTLPQA